VSRRIPLPLRREQDAYRSQFVDLSIERGYSFFQHPSVGRQYRTAEVVLCSRSSQLQDAASLFSEFGFGGQNGFKRCPALRFLLLGFNELGIESSGHALIVMISGFVVRDPWAGTCAT
jgi:hypothetical protein